MAKQLKRKELLKKEDGFITFLNKAISFINNNKKQFIIGVGIFIILVVGIYGFNIYIEKKEDKAFAKLEEIKKRYVEVLNTEGFKEGYKASQKDFEQLFQKFDGCVSAKLGMIVYGNIAYFAEDYEKAISTYQKALDSFGQDSLNNILLSNIAYSNLMINKEEKAMESFEKIASASDSIMKDSAFLNLGIFYKKQGNLEKSSEQFEQLAFIKDSMFVPMISENFSFKN